MRACFFAWLARRLAPYLADALKIEALAIAQDLNARAAERLAEKKYAGRTFIGEK